MKSVLFLFVFFPLVLFSQFTAKFSVHPEALPIDATLHVQLELAYPPDFNIHPEELRMNLLRYAGLSEPPFSLTSESIEEIPGGSALSYTLEPLVPGVHFLSFYAIRFSSPEKKDVELISEIVSVEVALPPKNPRFFQESGDLLSLTEQYPLELTPLNRWEIQEDPRLEEKARKNDLRNHHTRVIPWKMIAAACIIALFLALRRALPQRKTQKPPEISLDTIRKEVLRTLEQVKKEDPEDRAGYFMELCALLRVFMERAFHIPATTQTTAECVEHLSKHPAFSEELKKQLHHYFLEADRVKFSEAVPTRRQCEEAHEFIKMIVHPE